MDLDRIKQVGISAAYKGAEVLQSYFGNITRINKKGVIDLVTEADIKSEERIVSTIQTAFPDHTILAEESGFKEGTQECGWMVDPLDGTTNFTHQVPIFCISIAFAAGNDIRVGIVLNPINGELFTATHGSGAQLNGKPIRVSSTSRIDDSLLVTGFPYNIREMFDPIITRYASCLRAAQGVRRLGSAALDLCYVACGRFEGFWEQYLKPWDTAAGSIIAAEAGGQVTDFSNRSFQADAKEILATNGQIHDEMLSLLRLEENK